MLFCRIAKRGIEGLWRPLPGCAAEPPKGGAKGAVAAGRSTIELCDSKARPYARHSGYCGSTDRLHRPCRRGQRRGQEAISSRGGAICGRHGDLADPDNHPQSRRHHDDHRDAAPPLLSQSGHRSVRGRGQHARLHAAAGRRPGQAELVLWSRRCDGRRVHDFASVLSAGHQYQYAVLRRAPQTDGASAGGAVRS